MCLWDFFAVLGIIVLLIWLLGDNTDSQKNSETVEVIFQHEGLVRNVEIIPRIFKRDLQKVTFEDGKQIIIDTRQDIIIPTNTQIRIVIWKYSNSSQIYTDVTVL